jgi:uncharacterized membrane protein YraQ (UPF0718 family)
MLLLILSILALLVGPVIYRLVRDRSPALELIDGFIFVSMGGMMFFGVFPEAFGAGGWGVIVFAALGLLGPTLVERNFHRAGRGTHNLALALAMAGLCLHGFADGVALTEDSPVATSAAEGVEAHFHGHLPFAVILHRIPEGLTIWWLLRPALGRVVPLIVLALLSTSTALGFACGTRLLAELPEVGLAWFQALVAGSLLHVIFHRPRRKRAERGAPRDGHDHEHCAPLAAEWSPGWVGGAGGSLGLVFLVLFLGPEFLEEGRPAELMEAFLALASESALPLLIAYALAGLMSGFLPRSSIRWMRRGSAWSQSLRGMAVGLPIPICSCGVVPLYRTLVRQGAPATAAMAFLVATPELGLDALLISVPLLGGAMTLTRVAAAALLAFLVGWIVGGFTLRKGATRGSHEASEPPAAAPTFGERLRSGLAVGFGEGLDHTAPWILLGLIVAALVETFIGNGVLSSIPPSVDVLVFAVAGVPAYVCASGATPFVAVLLWKGASPGAALAFLLTGPATNVTTFGVLRELHGRRVAVVFGLAMILLAVAIGYATNLLPLLGTAGSEPPPAGEPSPLEVVSLALLGAIFLVSFVRRGPRRFIAELVASAE